MTQRITGDAALREALEAKRQQWLRFANECDNDDLGAVERVTYEECADDLARLLADPPPQPDEKGEEVGTRVEPLSSASTDGIYRNQSLGAVIADERTDK